MKLYKIIFEKNVPICAVLLDNCLESSVKIDTVAGKPTLMWITAFADNETEGVIIAKQLARDLARYL